MEAPLYKRYLTEQIRSWLFKKKVIILYGARQVGKTTLAREILNESPNSLYLNCESIGVQELLESRNIERIRTYIGNIPLVVFDEAQKVKNIGSSLKLIHDMWPDIQVIATGSSSFGLLNEVSEPLTGRNIKFQLFPLSYAELQLKHPVSELDEKLEIIMRYGMYPEIFLETSESAKRDLLDQLTSDYLFRDVFNYENLKRPELVVKLLKAIALQIGSEVTCRELSVLLKANIETIQRYLEILERSFILFKLGSFSRNLRKELSHAQKYYFYDLGLRNSLLQNTGPLSNRLDTGALWENFCIVERMKANQKNRNKVNSFFWRTYDQQEIDLIEESQGGLTAYELKYNPEARIKLPHVFLKTYPGSEFRVIHRNNYYSFFL